MKDSTFIILLAAAAAVAALLIRMGNKKEKAAKQKAQKAKSKAQEPEPEEEEPEPEEPEAEEQELHGRAGRKIPDELKAAMDAQAVQQARLLDSMELFDQKMQELQAAQSGADTKLRTLK